MEGQSVARATTFTYNVTVVNPGSGNKYYMDGILQSYITLFPGCTYEFNQDDSSNSGHPLRFATAADAAGSTEYTTGVTTSGTPGSATAWTKIEVTSDTAYLLYFYCTNHSGMGGEINIPPNFSISNSNDRIIAGGGDTAGGSFSNTIDIVQVRSKGNASDYGDLSLGRQGLANGCISSTTRGLFYAGDDSGPATYVDTIDFITMATTGNATDFGNATADDSGGGGFSNATRGGRGGGFTGTGNPFGSNIIDYVTIATTGNASDFGDLSSVRYSVSGLSSPTRGVFGGGYNPTNLKDMEFMTIATTGSINGFGDLTQGGLMAANQASNAIRGLYWGGAPHNNTNIDVITIATTGNAIKFGDMTVTKAYRNCMTSPTRAVAGGGQTPGDGTVTIDYVEIATEGNAVDFGDLREDQHLSGASFSNGHGGL